MSIQLMFLFPLSKINGKEAAPQKVLVFYTMCEKEEVKENEKKSYEPTRDSLCHLRVWLVLTIIDLHQHLAAT